MKNLDILIRLCQMEKATIRITQKLKEYSLKDAGCYYSNKTNLEMTNG
jgi:hypothetical protein